MFSLDWSTAFGIVSALGLVLGFLWGIHKNSTDLKKPPAPQSQMDQILIKKIIEFVDSDREYRAVQNQYTKRMTEMLDKIVDLAKDQQRAQEADHKRLGRIDVGMEELKDEMHDTFRKLEEQKEAIHFHSKQIEENTKTVHNQCKIIESFRNIIPGAT